MAVAGARVLALGTGRWTDTDGEGRYLLRGLPAGEYTLAAVAPECRVAAGPVTIAGGAWTSSSSAGRPRLSRAASSPRLLAAARAPPAA